MARAILCSRWRSPAAAWARPSGSPFRQLRWRTQRRRRRFRGEPGEKFSFLREHQGEHATGAAPRAPSASAPSSRGSAHARLRRRAGGFGGQRRRGRPRSARSRATKRAGPLRRARGAGPPARHLPLRPLPQRGQGASPRPCSACACSARPRPARHVARPDRGGSVARARDLVNGPANLVTPSYLAERAREDRRRRSPIAACRSPCSSARSAGSSAWAATSRSPAAAPAAQVHPPAVHAQGHRQARVRVCAWSGKGVTFDSGGLSLKPTDAMMDMKIRHGRRRGGARRAQERCARLGVPCRCTPSAARRPRT